MMGSSLYDLRFDNSYTRELPADPSPHAHRRQVYEACFSRVQPTPVSSPTLMALSPEVVELLGLSLETLDLKRFAHVFSGNQVLPGMDPYAACYGGHQFGNWAGQLGDGRAITLGEVLNSEGERWELQLKGAGPTPYSRMGDGRAVMRSSVREFLCSEAMHHLGVPTTRALCLVGTGDPVVRDMFYDGNIRQEPGAIVCRVSPSFLRFGSFEIFSYRRDMDRLRMLADYAIRTHFPHLGEPSPSVYVEWLREVGIRSAEMVGHWMRVGFVHGVMNTDNMSILGLTIDYGPYGWLEGYEPGWTPNTTDASMRRYCYGRQPRMVAWNLFCLANAIYPLVGDPAPLKEALEGFEGDLDRIQLETMGAKLGLTLGSQDEPMLAELTEVMQLSETDMTLFYRGLAEVPSRPDASDEDLLRPIRSSAYALDSWDRAAREPMLKWLRSYTERVRQQDRRDADRRDAMNAVNPLYVLRNYLAQLAIDDAEKGDPRRLLELLDVMRRPYTAQEGRESYSEKRPEWARDRPGCSTLSCSS
jgi:uncharacterized protein YdiU (UPF0061 family)